MMNTEKYSDVIKRRFVPATHKNSPNGDRIIQHDFSPCHTSRKMRKETEELKINMRQWPGIYPDINTIVNFRGIAKNAMLYQRTVNL
jgi:hypothetical protein